MTPRQEGRTAKCGRPDAAARFAQAEKFLEVAEVVPAEGADDQIGYESVSASLAVLAGIAAADAACCAALGRRSRGQDHKQATDLLRQVEPGGKEAAATLSRLLALKDTAHYGIIAVSGADLRGALRQARALIDFARNVINRQ